MFAQLHGRMRFFIGEQSLHRAHRLHQALPVVLAQRFEHCGHRVARARIEHGERLAALGREAQEALPAVMRRTPCPEEAAALETLQQPAEIADVYDEGPAQYTCLGISVLL